MSDEQPALSGALASALSVLRMAIDRHALPMLMSAYSNTRSAEHLVRLQLPAVPPALAILLRLLILGDEVDAASFRGVIEFEALDRLVDDDVFVRREDTIACRFKVVMAAGLLIFCEGSAADAQAYFGQDSLALSRIVGDARGAALDLCAGVGTHGLNLARTCESVVCVEVNANLAKLFAINCAVNRLTGRLKFQAESVESFHPSSRFDCIVCNPPLLPIPSGIPFPPTADGGSDGLKVVKTILQRLPVWLADDGEFRFVATILGSEAGPDVDALNELAVLNDLAIFLVLPSRWRTTEGDLAFEAILQTAMAYRHVAHATAYKDMKIFYAHPRRQWLYSVLGSVRHSQGTGSVMTTEHFELNRHFWHL